MKTFRTAVAVAIGTLFAGAAFAQSDFGIERRDAYLDSRIDRGVETGRITPREAVRLESQQERIERLEARARADGRLSVQERARIDHAQDRLSRDIHRESNDRQGTNGGRFGNNRGYYGGNYGHNNGGYYGHNNGGYYGHNNGGTYGNIERRDQRQDARIDRGVASGQITSQEAARLEGNRARIERMETRARSDGHLSGQERARIDHAQDRLGRSIYRQSHDNQTTTSPSSVARVDRSDRVARADRPDRVAQTRSTTTPRVRTGGTRTDGERRNR